MTTRKKNKKVLTSTESNFTDDKNGGVETKHTGHDLLVLGEVLSDEREKRRKTKQKT